MSVVSFFSGAFCREGLFVQELIDSTGYRCLDDEVIVSRARDLSLLPVQAFRRAFSNRSSVFDPFTRERERAIIWLKLALAEQLQDIGMILNGFVTHLIPSMITHSLRVCLIADMDYRIETASSSLEMDPEKASSHIRQLDQDRTAWVQTVRSVSDPWCASLYDLVFPVNKTTVKEAVGLIRQSLETDAVKVSEASRRAAQDFLTSARIESALAREGHFINVSAQVDRIILYIDRPVLMQERLEAELKDIIGTVSDLPLEVQVATKPEEQRTYHPSPADQPSKVLLVDDEREFVQTLSERLGMRDIGSAAVFDGASALAMLDQDEPEVMVLDLRMPGIDGITVLKKVKAEHPAIEVIVLTGHGTDVDRKQCMDLGAFAYLEKPVDIEVLSETLRKANQKIRDRTKKQTK